MAPHRARRRHDRGQGARARRRRRGSRAGRGEYPLSTPRPGWAEQDPEDWWRATQEALERARRRAPPRIGLSGQMHGLVALDAAERVHPPGDPLERPAHRRRVRGDRGARRPRAARRSSPATARSTGFTAPKLLWLREHEPERVGADRARAAAEGLRPAAADRRAARPTSATRRARCCSTSRARAWSDEVLDALEIDRRVAAARARVARGHGRTHDGVPVAAGAGDQAAGAVGVGVDRPGGPLSVALGDQRRRLRRAGPRSRRTSGPACTRSATRCRARGTRWA